MYVRKYSATKTKFHFQQLCLADRYWGDNSPTKLNKTIKIALKNNQGVL